MLRDLHFALRGLGGVVEPSSPQGEDGVGELGRGYPQRRHRSGAGEVRPLGFVLFPDTERSQGRAARLGVRFAATELVHHDGLQETALADVDHQVRECRSGQERKQTCHLVKLTIHTPTPPLTILYQGCQGGCRC